MSAFDAYMRLEGTLKGAVKSDEPMARHTTYRIGGPASLYTECASLADLALVCDVLVEEGVDAEIVGKGSNLLVADEGYDGAVITLTGEFAEVDYGDVAKTDENGGDADDASLERGQELHVIAGAAVPLARLVQEAYGRGLSGLEALVGIPGTLGGALFMNAGTRDDWIGSRVARVTVYRPGKGLEVIHGSELAWEYRSSGISEDVIIVEAELVLRAASKDAIAESMQSRLDARGKHQPLSAHCCGSVFKNPENASAGKLIQECGLAGASCGDARISEQHANFIINDGSAHANDVLALMRLARDRVKENHGIRLTPEVKFLGFPR